MSFIIVCIISLVTLAVIAGIATHFDSGDDELTVGHDCSTCTAADEGTCKIHCLMEEAKKKEKVED